jgi:hypothetical protein
VKVNLLGSDSTAYIQGAESLLKHGVFSSMGDISAPDNFRTIGYSIVIALTMSINHEYYISIVIAMQVFLMYLMFVRFINIGDVFNIKYSYIVLIPFIFHPEMLNLATSLQTESLYVFTLFMFFLFTVRYLKTRHIGDLILSAVFISVSLHIKPVYLFFIIPYLLLIFSFDRSIRRILIVIITMTIIISPWILRNKMTLDTYSFTSSKNFNLLCYAYSVTKEKDSLSNSEAISKVDSLLIDKYNLKTDGNASILSLVSSQNNKLIDDILPVAAKDIILDNIEYLPGAYIKGVLRGFYLPHTIYNVDKSSSLHISNFINKVKEKDTSLVFMNGSSKIDYKVLYFHFFPLILNFIVLIGLLLFSALWIAKRQFRTYQTLFVLLFVWYGVLVAFPWSNNSRYMMAYFPQMAIMLIYSLNFLYRKNE